MNVRIITIGDELLIGQTTDTNSAHIASRLSDCGFRVTEMTTIGDEPDEIARTFAGLQLEERVVLLTGGLGPTRDDKTRQVLADLAGVKLEFHEPTWERIERIMSRMGRRVTEGHKWQCMLPQNASLLHNRLGSAPGIWMEIDGRIWVALPGVPYEMKALLAEEVIPRLMERLTGEQVISHTLHTAGEVESALADLLESFEDTLPKGFSLAYLPAPGRVRLRLTARGINPDALQHDLDLYTQTLRTMLGDLVFGEGETSLALELGRLISDNGLQISSAESCTGGYVSHLITSIPGSSGWFPGSVITYSNELKTKLLSVSTDTLKAHGAVSEQTVREMVAGLLPLCHADIGLAISGIAGPGGGSPEKPVGTVWIACGNREHTDTLKLTIGKDRLLNIEFAAFYALNFARLFVLKHY